MAYIPGSINTISVGETTEHNELVKKVEYPLDQQKYLYIGLIIIVVLLFLIYLNTNRRR